MASVLKVDKLDPQSGTALEIGTSGDTITVPSGATFNVAGTMQSAGVTVANTPFFYAYRATNWDVANASLTTIPLDTVLYQTGSTFNTSTYVWTPGEAGTYKLYAVTRSTDSSWGNLEMYIKTSVAAEVARAQGTITISSTLNLSVIRTLTSSENVFCTMYQDSGSTKTFTGGSALTFFCGFKLIGA